MKHRYFFIDFDGVLVSTQDLHFEILNSSLEHHGYSSLSYEEHLEHYNGLPTTKKLQKLLESGRIDAKDIQSISEYKQIETEKSISSVEIPPEILKTIEELSSVGRCAITSNCSKRTVDIVLDNGGSQYFDLIVTKDDVPNPKPLPDMYEYAMSFYECVSDDCLIIDDLDFAKEASEVIGVDILKINSLNDMFYENFFKIYWKEYS